MAAFLVARNVESLRVQLREPTASNAGAEAANCNKTIVFNHIKTSEGRNKKMRERVKPAPAGPLAASHVHERTEDADADRHQTCRQTEQQDGLTGNLGDDVTGQGKHITHSSDNSVHSSLCNLNTITSEKNSVHKVATPFFKNYM